MNIDRFSPLLKRTTLLLSLMAGSFLLAGCGGGSDKKSSASSSSISSSSLRSSFSAASVPPNGSGIWPSVKVEAQTPKVLTFQWSAVDGATFYKLYKHDAATGGVVQVGGDLTATKATDEIGVHVHDWVNNYYYVDACNAGGCQRSDLTFTATEMIKAIGYFKASNAEANDFFGWSIALSADGTTLAVGAPTEDSKAIGANGDQTNNDSTNSGAVYVFVKENGVWIQQAYLKASNTEQPNVNSLRVLPNDRFGYKVALSDDGNTLAVSALLEDSPSYGVNCNQNNYEVTNYGTSSDPSDDLIAAVNYDMGAVYVFTRNSSEWLQEAYVKPLYSLIHKDLNGGLRFGESISLSGDGKTLAVGATSDGVGLSDVVNFHNSSFSSNPSEIECYEYYPSSSASSVSSSSTSSSSSSKSSVSSSSSSDFPGGTASGAVYIYVKTADKGWKEESYLKASNAEPSDAFGTSIALSTDGNTMAVGAIGEDSNATGVNGDQANNACYYFNESTYTIDPECEKAGKYAVRGLINNGAAYVFKRTGNLWGQEAYFKPSSTFIKTAFGTSVDLSGDGTLLAVGATGDASNASGINGDTTQQIDYANTGATYIFSKSGSGWAQEAMIKPSTLTKHSGVALASNGNGTYDIQISDGGQFGGNVSLSQDGKTLAVGSFRESSNAKGINGDQGDTSAARSGAVFVFKRNNTVWTQQSYVKASNTDSDDRFGVNVDLSADGKTMAVSAHREAGRGYAAASSGASTSSATSSNSLDQSDNSADAAGAVYVY
ncbi:FG-GAP repeat protein [Cellvibrio sp. OA-2007]|uniref:FG-GAP repeat protein n=1 Tax=Cellvibrio sp. OA-2007 TaxID=529823 RepID=UPI000785917F|nr:FG-GAP repeat protein [Cellvibrio sp. OA-2007]